MQNKATVSRFGTPTLYQQALNLSHTHEPSIQTLIQSLNHQSYYAYFEQDKQKITVGIGQLFGTCHHNTLSKHADEQALRIKQYDNLPCQVTMVPYDAAEVGRIKNRTNQSLLTISPEILVTYDLHTKKISGHAYVLTDETPSIAKQLLARHQITFDKLFARSHVKKSWHEPLSFRFDKNEDQYHGAFMKAQDAIKRGDVFQLVLSNTLKANGTCDMNHLFLQLVKEQSSPYVLVFKEGDHTYVSATPEILIEKTGQDLKTVPIAGTCPRKYDGRDSERASALLKNPKERAEHLMLVDLGRNDLGRVSQAGSVAVTTYATLKHLSHVSHLSSTVESTMSSLANYLDPFMATLPAGTVTGAPKEKAMTLIAQIEKSPRQHYAGAFLIEDMQGNYTSLITIRTLYQHKHELTLRVGSGIVYDSTFAGESRELIHKANGLLKSLKAIHPGGVTYDFDDRPL